MAIVFSEEKKFVFNTKRKTKTWIKQVISLLGKECGDINYIFVDDEKLLTINKQYLNHDFYTDIITFDYTQGDTLNGDIFISVERVKENAVNFETFFDEELHRVIIHGVLHLAGYKDHTEKEDRQMREKENEALKLFYC